jgi:hypothetical protein
MKKTLLAAVAAFPFLAGAADLSAGTVQLSGSSALGLGGGTSELTYRGRTTTTTSAALGLSTTAFFHVARNLGVGLFGAYSRSTSTTKDGSTTATVNDEETSSWFSVGPAVSFQLPVAEKLSLFGQVEGGWVRGSGSYSSGNRSSDYTTKGLVLGTEAGVKFFPAASVSLDAGLTWTWRKQTQDSPDTTTRASNVAAIAGVSIYLGGGR